MFRKSSFLYYIRLVLKVFYHHTNFYKSMSFQLKGFQSNGLIAVYTIFKKIYKDVLMYISLIVIKYVFWDLLHIQYVLNH